jgi:hypothetical protein
MISYDIVALLSKAACIGARISKQNTTVGANAFWKYQSSWHKNIAPYFCGSLVKSITQSSLVLNAD